MSQATLQCLARKAQQGNAGLGERSLLVDKILYHPRHDVATEILLLSHEPIRWDLEEMQRHLKEPHFAGQPQKVHIFFRWFEVYFCKLVKMSHGRTQRLLSAILVPQALPISSASSTSTQALGEQGSEDSDADSERLSATASVSRLLTEHQETLEREMRAVRSLMQEVLDVKAPLLKAQPDDRPNVAEELRGKVEDLGEVLRRCMALEEEALVPWIRSSVDPEDARAALEGEWHGDVPAMGWMGLSMWLPWVMHAMERWCSPKDVTDFRDRLPWLVGGLQQYLWEPLYMSTNWALLQSMADPLEEEDTGDYDDDL